MTEMAAKYQNSDFSNIKIIHFIYIYSLLLLLLSLLLLSLSPIALRNAEIVYNFGLSECNRAKDVDTLIDI